MLISKPVIYVGVETRDNQEWNFYWEHPFPRVSQYKRRCDIKEVDITEFRVYRCAPGLELGLAKLQLVIKP